MTTTVLEAIGKIKKIAKENSERVNFLKVHDIKNIITVGKCFRQGDLYPFLVPFQHSVGEYLPNQRQLALGSSKGSRHVLVGDFKIYKGVLAPKKVKEPYSTVGLGFAFDVLTEARLNHPDHDDFILPAGRYQVIHQLDLRTLRKAQD